MVRQRRCRRARTVLFAVLWVAILALDRAALALPFSRRSAGKASSKTIATAGSGSSSGFINSDRENSKQSQSGHSNAAAAPSGDDGDDDGDATTARSTTATTTSQNVPTTTSGRSRPERGQLLPAAANAQDLYDAYASIQADYERKAFHSPDWTVLNAQRGVTVSLLHHPDDPTCPYVKMEGVIPVPVHACWNFLRVSDWDRTMPKMDPFYEGVTVYGEYDVAVPAADRLGKKSPGRRFQSAPTHAAAAAARPEKNCVHMILCRKRMSRILAFGKRDLVFLSVTEDEPLNDGSLVSGTVSVRTALVPRVHGYTRAFQDSIAFYKPIKGGTETYVGGRGNTPSNE